MLDAQQLALLEAVQQYLDQVLPVRLALPLRQIEAQYQLICEANKGLTVDEISRKVVAVCALFLSAYRELLPVVGDHNTIVAALSRGQKSLLEPGIEAYVESRMGIRQDEAAQAFDLASRNFKRRGEEIFGSRWVYEQEAQEANHSFVNVTKCLYLDVFSANDALEILPAVCSADEVWADELNKPKYNTRVEIASRLSQGSDRCRFRFFRVGGAIE